VALAASAHPGARAADHAVRAADHAARAPDHAVRAADHAARAPDHASIGRALAAALPADGQSDLLLIERTSGPAGPRVFGATRTTAAPAAIKAALLDSAHYHTLIPALEGSSVVGPGRRATRIDWDLDVPLFDLSGRIALYDRPDGVTLELVDGDLSPGRIIFSIVPHPAGGSTLIIDAQLDVKRSSWLLRHIMARSPAGEPAVLAAAAYVALRATALRAEHPTGTSAWRPSAPPGTSGLPDPTPLAADSLAPLRARGSLALVARERSERLGGVAIAAGFHAPAAALLQRLRDPDTWRAFPGWHTVRVRAGSDGPGAEVEDNLPLVDFDATWIADPGSTARWTVAAGATRGAHLGWNVFAPGGTPPGPAPPSTLAALTLYPRLEATGTVARRFIQAEPLLEEGLALALAYTDLVGVGAALDTPP
jgi:hypothetical protein